MNGRDVQPSSTMSLGFSAFLDAIKIVRGNDELKSWYRKTIFKTVLLALFLLLVILTGGIWYIQSFITDTISRMFVVGLLAFAALYFSTTIAALLMNSLVNMVGGEDALRRHFFPGVSARGGLHLKDRGAELLSVFKSLGFAILAVPFFMMAWAIPLGIFVIALGMGGEALATANRLSHEHGIETAQDRKQISWQLKMGLGLIPAGMSLIPLIGFFFLPLSVIAALSIQSRSSASRNT